MAAKKPADTAQEPTEAAPARPDRNKVSLEHPDGSKITVLKPSAEYTNMVGVHGWKEV